MRKKDRHRLINRLLNENVIRKQEDFVEILKNQGIDVTQATISRDIKEMKLIKVPSVNGGYQYSMPAETKENLEERLDRLLTDGFVGVDVMDKFVYVKALPGNAAAIGKLVEKQFKSNLFAALNDDDGVLILARSESAAQDLKEFFMQYL